MRHTRTGLVAGASCILGSLLVFVACLPTPVLVPVAEVEPTASQTVKVGETKNLTYRVLNALGHSISIDPNRVVWAVTAGEEHLEFTHAKAVGLTHGEAMVVAIIDGVSSVPVKVIVNPVPRVILIPPLTGADPNDPFNDAAGISADGRVVVGTSDSTLGLQAYRWTEAGGSVGLGILSGYEESDGSAVNADGSVIVGACVHGRNQADSRSVPFIWTAANGMIAIELPEGATQGDARSVSADGKRVVGRYEIPNDGADNIYGSFGFLWEEGQDLRTFSDFIPEDASREHFCSFNSISADGTVIAATTGYTLMDNPDPQQDAMVISAAVRWLAVGESWEPRILGWTPDGQQENPDWRLRTSTANVTNADGSVMWGTTQIPGVGFIEPFRWTPTTGMAANIWGQMFVMQASSHDGEIAVGGGADAGNGIIWDTKHGVRSMYGVMEELGILEQMDAYQVVSVLSVSADGQAMVGIGSGGGGGTSFNASVVWPPHAAPGEAGMFRGFYVEIPREND